MSCTAHMSDKPWCEHCVRNAAFEQAAQVADHEVEYCTLLANRNRDIGMPTATVEAIVAAMMKIACEIRALKEEQ